MKSIKIKNNCISLSCNTTNVFIHIYKNDILLLSATSISVLDSIPSILGISGTFENVFIDDTIHYGEIRIDWEILNDCGEKITSRKNICIEQCNDCNQCLVGNFQLEVEDVDCIAPEEITLEIEDIDCPAPIEIYLSSTTEDCDSALGPESYTVKATANDTCDDFLVNKIDIVSKELATNVSKNVVTSLGCDKVELNIPKGKWVTIVNDDLSRVEIDTEISIDNGVTYNTYQFSLNDIPPALSSVFQSPTYIRKYYADLYNKIGTVNIYLRFLNTNLNVFVRAFQIDFLNGLPYQSVGSDYSVFSGLGDNSKEVFNFIATTQGTQNITMNNILTTGSDEKHLTFNFTVAGQITYQIK